MPQPPRTRSLFSALLVAATLCACTVLTDASELEADAEADSDTSGAADQSATCTLNLDLACPAGTEKRPFEERGSYGVCDAGTESRYLRDLDGLKGFCNGVEGCGYVCVKGEDAPAVCDGNVSCPPGSNSVNLDDLTTELARVTEGKAPVTDTTCLNNRILDDAGQVVATCHAKEGCAYFCVREFSVGCACGEAPGGGCQPCPTCTETSLTCADGTCIEVDAIREGICAEQKLDPCPEELRDTVRCVWYDSAPPINCSPEGLELFKPSEEVLGRCIQNSFLFECEPGGAKIPGYQFCDGTAQCANSADEPAEYCSLKCDPEDPNSAEVSWIFYCNGANDCPNGLDESDALCRFPCDPEDPNTAYIDYEQTCNGTAECSNSADEDPLLCPQGR